MFLSHQLFLVALILFNISIFAKAAFETNQKHNAFGLTHFLFWEGIFVWADAVIFSLFWILAAAVSLVLNSWTLFWLIVSLFWVVRSLGETIYWFLEQFAPVKRNPPATLLFYNFFHGESIWFVYQIIWQCVMVFAAIATIYLAHSWLGA